MPAPPPLSAELSSYQAFLDRQLGAVEPFNPVGQWLSATPEHAALGIRRLPDRDAAADGAGSWGATLVEHVQFVFDSASFHHEVVRSEGPDDYIYPVAAFHR